RDPRRPAGLGRRLVLACDHAPQGGGLVNPVEPDLPASLEPLLRRVAAEDPLETHPAAATLRSYDEEPDALSPRTRAWIEAHLATCAACAEALRSVPQLELRARPLLRAWPLAAAAGWILAAFLGFRSLAPARVEPVDPLLSVHSIVLST